MPANDLMNQSIGGNFHPKNLLMQSQSFQRDSMRMSYIPLPPPLTESVMTQTEDPELNHCEQ